jgi:dolichol-phosphate mannosyltransferase
MIEKIYQDNTHPNITLIIPCYNEEAILSSNVRIIERYLKNPLFGYSWEILLINDGSKDNTGEIANELSNQIQNLRVIHHPINLNLGCALQTGFKNAKGEIIVVLDIDLSYAPECIVKLADALYEESADIVIASPYMNGGKVVAVPFVRRKMSRWVNRFMQISAQDKYYTFTGMVRAYRT